MTNWQEVRTWGGRLGCLVLVTGLIFIGPGLILGIGLIAGSQRTIYQRSTSPDGWHEARVQFDDGGAISGFDRIVLIKHSWNFSDEPLLSCRAFLANGQADVKLVWRDSHTLLIQHHFAPKNIVAGAGHCGSTDITAQAVEPFEKFD